MNMKTFTCWGFDEVGEADDHVFGVCPLCSCDDKFYINRATLQWDCKICGESGNEHTFLSKLAVSQERDEGALEELSVSRGISVETLDAYGVFWHDLTDVYGIPKWNEEHKQVVDIRRLLEDGRLMVTTGAKQTMLDADVLADAKNGDTVWICEGEWDAMRLFEELVKADRGDETVVAMPGANIFKKDWVQLFSRKHVRVMYDNDKAGRKGTEKVVGLLGQSVRSLQVLVWPKERPDKWDVRDELNEPLEPRVDIVGLESMLENRVDVAESLESEGEQVGDENIWRIWVPGDLGTEERFTPEMAWEEMSKLIDVSDSLKAAFRVTWAGCLGAQFPHMPLLWTYIIGPSGCGKSLALMSARGTSTAYCLSSFTPSALVSGWTAGDTDPSILPRWNLKNAVIKDWTTILTDHPQTKANIYSILRDAYDGECIREFGNGVKRRYRLTFNLTLGVTHAVKAEKQSNMGERFLRLEFNQSSVERDRAVEAALASVGKVRSVDMDLADITGRVLSREFLVDEVTPNLTPMEADKMMRMANYITYLRTDVDRNEYTDVLNYRPVTEIATRMVRQLASLYAYLCALEGSREEAWELLKRVAYDTARGFKQDVVRVLWEVGGEGVRVSELREKVRMGHNTLDATLNELVALECVEKEELSEKGSPRLWNLTTEFRDMMDSI